MKKNLILVVALLFATLTVTTAQRKVATDKLQVTVGFDAKGNAFAKEFPKVDLSPIQAELSKKLNAGAYEGTAQDLATQLNDAVAKVVTNEASLTDLTAVINTTKQKLESLKVADVGGLQEEIARLEGLIANAGKIKTVNGVEPDENGDIALDIPQYKAGKNISIDNSNPKKPVLNVIQDVDVHYSVTPTGTGYRIVPQYEDIEVGVLNIDADGYYISDADAKKLKDAGFVGISDDNYVECYHCSNEPTKTIKVLSGFKRVEDTSIGRGIATPFQNFSKQEIVADRAYLLEDGRVMLFFKPQNKVSLYLGELIWIHYNKTIAKIVQIETTTNGTAYYLKYMLDVTGKNNGFTVDVGNYVHKISIVDIDYSLIKFENCSEDMVAFAGVSCKNVVSEVIYNTEYRYKFYYNGFMRYMDNGVVSSRKPIMTSEIVIDNRSTMIKGFAEYKRDYTNNPQSNIFEIVNIKTLKEYLKKPILLTPAPLPDYPKKGLIYFDSSDNKLKCYDGTEWHNLW